MKTKKLPIPGIVCPICNSKFNKTSHVVIINEKIILHSKKRCSMNYVINENHKLPENKRRTVSIWDYQLYYTDDYEKSSKSISIEKLEQFKKQYALVQLPKDTMEIKIEIRDKIWKYTATKYAVALQNIHALNRIWERQKDTINSNFHKTFIPSALTQFRSKGYLSNKQWDIVKNIIRTKISEDDRHYYHNALHKAGDITNLDLPDTLRLMQRRNSFIRWFNEKEGIKEKDNE